MYFARHVLFLFLLSVLVILAASYLNVITDFLLQAYHWVTQFLKPFLSQNRLGLTIRQVLGLFLVPTGITFLIGTIIWMFRRHHSDYLVTILWLLWLALATLIVAYR